MARKGFTLIELLVVVAIISMIAAVVVSFFAGARARARDATREHDMKSIQSAINLYINQTSTYPICTTEAYVSVCLKTLLVNAGTMPSVPNDPQFSGVGTCGDAGVRAYCYQSDTEGTDYTLSYNLETDSIPGKSQGWNVLNP